MTNIHAERLKVAEAFGGTCMLDSVQAAEQHFIGGVLTEDVSEFYEYPRKIQKTPNLMFSDRHNLDLFYILSCLQRNKIIARNLEVPLKNWQPDDWSGCTKYGIIQNPMIDMRCPNGSAAIEDLPGNHRFPLLISSFDERSGEGHIWFAPNPTEFEADKTHHLVDLNSQAENFYLAELHLQET